MKISREKLLNRIDEVTNECRAALKYELFGSADKKLLADWKRFHKKNPDVYNLFKRFTFEAYDTGRPYYSHWAIAQRIRWYTTVETSGSEFKLANDLIAIYARV
jgi:hypothetical protein